MKKQNLFKSMLLLCALVAGSGSVWGQTYVKVTSEPTDWSGVYLIVYEGDGGSHGAYAFDGAYNEDKAKSNIAVTISAGVINGTDALNAAAFTIAKIGSTSNYSILNSKGSYIGATRNSNEFKLSTTDVYPNTIEFEDGTNNVDIHAVFDESNRYLRFNYGSDQLRFRYFQSGKQQPIALYRKNETATINSTYKWATFSSKDALDFTGISTLSAYRASSVSASSVTLTQVTGTCAANTGLLLNGATTNIPVAASGTSFTSSENKLVAVSSAKTLTSADKAYVLTADGGGNVFFGKVDATSANIAAGQAYLDGTDIYANELTFDFANGDVTGINEVKEQKAGFLGDFYNLAGQRVTRPGKGVYIVNGKKVIIK